MPDGIVWPSLLSAGVEAENKTAVSLEEQPFSVKLPPIDLHASQSTFLELAAAMAAGAGLVALVGREGSGKTYMLEALTRAPQPADRVSVRTADQPVAKGASLDLVDAVDDAALRLLAAEPAFTGRRVVAIRPDTLDRLLAFDPAARVVQMRPIGWRDVRALLEERRKLFRLPLDQFTLKALSLLEKLCDGNPGRLDFLACHAILAAQAEKSCRVTTIHVVGAARKLLAPSSRKAPPQRSEAPPDLPAPADATPTPTQVGPPQDRLTRPAPRQEYGDVAGKQEPQADDAAQAEVAGAKIAAVLAMDPASMRDMVALRWKLAPRQEYGDVAGKQEPQADDAAQAEVAGAKIAAVLAMDPASMRDMVALRWKLERLSLNDRRAVADRPRRVPGFARFAAGGVVLGLIGAVTYWQLAVSVDRMPAPAKLVRGTDAAATAGQSAAAAADGNHAVALKTDGEKSGRQPFSAALAGAQVTAARDAAPLGGSGAILPDDGTAARPPGSLASAEAQVPATSAPPPTAPEGSAGAAPQSDVPTPVVATQPTAPPPIAEAQVSATSAPPPTAPEGSTGATRPPSSADPGSPLYHPAAQPAAQAGPAASPNAGERPGAAAKPPSTSSGPPRFAPPDVRLLLSRGDELLALGDISAARLLYERAAAVGSARAATGLGKTYDPAFLASIRASGITPDRAAAASWYRKGAALGDAEAADRLARLAPAQ